MKATDFEKPGNFFKKSTNKILMQTGNEGNKWK